jgi:UrcA family protein
MKVMIALSLAAATCLLFQISTLVYADSRRGANSDPSIHLDVEHLDLGKPGVAAALYAQIQKSASRLCRDSSAPWDGGRAATWRRCVSAAIDEAIRQANAPELTALHQSEKSRGDTAGYQRQAVRSP